MTERQVHELSDPALEAALRELASVVGWPSAAPRPGSPDLATIVRSRIERLPAPSGRRARWPAALRWPTWSWRPARGALILAILAALAVAAVAGALGLGLPGLRLILGEPPGSPQPSLSSPPPASASPAALGSSMGLGEPQDPGDRTGLDGRAGFAVALPTDPAVGPPETAYVDDDRGGQVTLLWPAGPRLPATLEPDVGLLLGQFEGAVDQGFFTKMIGAGSIVERVRVDGQPGFWISGEPHVLFWDGPRGTVDDGRRWVGDVLIWSDGPITFRLESALGRDAAVRIAESVR